MYWMQWLSATITAYVFENRILKTFFEFLWPRLKTLRLAEDLRRQGKIEEEKLMSLPKVRYFRHFYMNGFVVVPLGFCVLLFLSSLLYYKPTLKHIVAVMVAVIFIYLMIWDDYKDEWRYVNLVTNGKRTRGRVISCKKRPIGNGVEAKFEFLTQEDFKVSGHMFLWHGVAPSFYFLPGDEVEVAYDPLDPKKCIIITDEVEAFNFKTGALQ